jgi:diguanylate cyclase (GGDEF)-like protein
MNKPYIDVYIKYLNEIVQTIKISNHYEEVFHRIIDSIVRIFKSQTCAVIIIDPGTEYLNIQTSYGLSYTFEKAFRRRLATGAIGKLLWTGKPILLKDSTQQSQLAEEVRLELAFGSCACVQIGCDARTIGYLYIDSITPNSLDENDLNVLQTFADLAGLAYTKAVLYTENLRLDRFDRETGLLKYIGFIEEVNRSVKRCKEFNEQFALLLSDIDNFKEVANTYGYDASRQLLREIGEHTRQQCRGVDVVGRYGFDELIVLRINTSSMEAVELAEKLSKTIIEKSFVNERIKTSVCTGVSVFPENGTDAESLVLAAKQALFEAQRKGKGSAVLFAQS